MFKVQSIALTAALIGYTSAQSGCYPTYNPGASYSVDDWVSATVTTTTPQNYVLQPDGTWLDTGGVTTTTTHNFKCISDSWCGNAGYAPGSLYESSAWSKETAECSGTQAPPAAVVPPPYNGANSGCPALYSGGDNYAAGDLVSVVKAAYTAVYECASASNNLFCGMAGYEPNEGLYWQVVWTEVGSCSGTLSPTGSPSFDSITNIGGCPNEYIFEDDYEEGDRVSKNGLVYQCKAFPASSHCKQHGYEPGTDLPTPENPYWKQAWDLVGYCSGTIAPTSSPSFVTLEDLGGCPNTWYARTAGEAYEEGDRVSDGKLVYECKMWPYSAHCGQAGYEPNTNPATPEAWKDAWVVKGYCSGSIGPTASPSFDPANLIGPCPDDWEFGSNVKYEEGDMVSVTVSEIPLRRVAFTCKAWPYSGHCGQYSPLHPEGGKLGWTLAGSCDGSIGPTASPSFDSLTFVTGGCPSEYSSSVTDYEAGDLVSLTVSTSPERKVVYECKNDIHNSKYCNNREESYAPGEWAGYLGWTLKGHCEGSVPPTTSPVQYNGVCTYIKCEEDVTCNKGDASNGVQGSTACSCTSTSSTNCTTGTQTVCAVTPVNLWSEAAVSTYDYGDVVRIGAQRYKCKQYAEGGWCSIAAYKPDGPIGGDAWTLDGMCP